MIFGVIKFNVKPEWSERWLVLNAELTEATRNEPGNLWFEWSRSVDNPNQFVLLEAYQDDATEAHMSSDHFRNGMQKMPQALASTPVMISEKTVANSWSPIEALAVA